MKTTTLKGFAVLLPAILLVSISLWIVRFLIRVVLLLHWKNESVGMDRVGNTSLHAGKRCHQRADTRIGASSAEQFPPGERS